MSHILRKRKMALVRLGGAPQKCQIHLVKRIYYLDMCVWNERALSAVAIQRIHHQSNSAFCKDVRK